MKRKKQKTVRKHTKQKPVISLPRQRTVRQHTVPRSYLERFLFPETKHLHVLDKQTGTIYANNPSNVSVENRFYDLPDDFPRTHFPKDYDDQFLEHGLAKAESQFKQDLDQFLADVETTGITPIYRAMLAPFIVIQALRGRENREKILQQKELLSYAICKEQLKKEHPDWPFDDVEIKYNRDLLVVDQSLQLLDSNYIEQIGLDLLKHIWVVGINQTMQPFYTSDNPVVKEPHVFKPGRSFTGFRARGISILFPLSSTHILVMYERQFFQKTYGYLENGVFKVTPAAVNHFNDLQVKQSYRHVICGKREFEQAQGVCRRFPEVCDPNRKRVKVEVNGDYLALLTS